MAGSDKTRHIKKDAKKTNLIAAMRKCLGVVTSACKKAKVSRQTFYQYMKDDPDFAEEINDIQNEAKDFVESQLYKLIEEGNTTATIFYLKTKAKDRGYSERMEIESKNTNHNINEGEQVVKVIFEDNSEE